MKYFKPILSLIKICKKVIGKIKKWKAGDFLGAGNFG